MNDLSLELGFTEVYRAHSHEDRAIREAHVLRYLMPRIFQPIEKQDLFAGRIKYPPLCFGLEEASGGPVYCCYPERVRSKMDRLGVSDEHRAEVEAMIAFWEKENTMGGRLVSVLLDDILTATSNTIAHMFGRLAGSVIDFTTLVNIGIPGLRERISKGREQHGDLPLYKAMEMALDLLVDIMHWYEQQALQLAQDCTDEKREMALLTIADSLHFIADNKPATFHQALQLHWLYALISGVVNYGRMDVAMGDFLAADLAAGRVSEAEALAMLQSLWQMMADRKIVFNGRVFIGGLGRLHVENADRFAMLAMEATRTVIEIEPQLTLRIYDGMNPILWEKALDVIGEGRTFPMLFNDDVNVAAVSQGFKVSYDDAMNYLPYGCGEYALEGISFGSPNCSLNPLKALEVTLHNGVDIMTGEPTGLALGGLEQFATFDDLWRVYKTQLEYHVEQLANRHAIEYTIEDQEAAFLFISMLYDDCIARGKSVVGGGVRYRGGIIETFGMVNAADSLNVIKQLVYEQKRLTLRELVTALDADFVGHEDVYQMIQQVKKYGNDDDTADAVLQQVSDHVALHTYHQAERIGFDYYLIVNVNNKGNVTAGMKSIASADGRRSGAPLANGNTPTAGNDHCGVTAFLNSIVKPDPTYHAGYTHNMKFNPRMFREERPKLNALLETYFACGGTQSMITVVNRGDLEAAMREPEKYRHLIVRVGGFSARFVELDPEVQLDLLARTLY